MHLIWDLIYDNKHLLLKSLSYFFYYKMNQKQKPKHNNQPRTFPGLTTSSKSTLSSNIDTVMNQTQIKMKEIIAKKADCIKQTNTLLSKKNTMLNDIENLNRRYC